MAENTEAQKDHEAFQAAAKSEFVTAEPQRFGDVVNPPKNPSGYVRDNDMPRVGSQRDSIMQYFDFAHLPVDLQFVSTVFHNTAVWIEANLPRNPERTVALRKLLEAKDAAVRAQLSK
jgi:hypothetical protein